MKCMGAVTAQSSLLLSGFGLFFFSGCFHFCFDRVWLASLELT